MLCWRPDYRNYKPKKGEKIVNWFKIYKHPVEVNLALTVPELWAKSHHAEPWVPKLTLTEDLLEPLKPWFRKNKAKAIWNAVKTVKISGKDRQYDKFYYFKFIFGGRVNHAMFHLIDIYFKNETDANKFRKHIMFLKLKNA